MRFGIYDGIEKNIRRYGGYTMVIDANLYWIPETLFTDSELQNKFLSEVTGRYDWFGHVENVEGTDKVQFIMEKPRGFANLNYVQGEYELEKQLADMDDAGIDKAVMKLPGCAEWLDLELCQYFNDKAAEHAKKSGGRLTALAVVPPYSMDENIEELRRCSEELGLKTVQLSAHYGDKYLDNEAFSGFFEKLNELNMNAYVHHTPVPVEYQSFRNYDNVRRSYGRLVDQGLAVSREMYSGFFNKYPNVKLAHSMMGGAFYAIQEMLLPHGPMDGGAVRRFQGDTGNLAEQLNAQVVYEMSHAQPWGKQGLEYAVSVVGADHVIYGSSYPVKMDWMKGGPEFIRNLDITGEEKEQILHKNAERFYQL